MKSGMIITALFVSAVAASALAQSIQVPQPSRGLMPNPNLGKPLYEKHCVECHGTALKGSDKGPPLLHRFYEPSHHSDASFQLAVRNGTRQHHWKFGDMAPVPGVTPDEVAHMTAYVRSQQRRVGIR